MHPSSRALRALAHPGSLAAIGVLLINDHLLKSAVGNALTGKLSDFAGLVFFPLLLSTVIGPVARRHTIATATAITAAWFAAINTSAVAARLTEQAVETVLGIPTRIVTDPTDLIALPALYLSIRIWRAADGHRFGVGLRVAGVLMALLATTATSWPEPGVGVLSLDAEADVIVASGIHFRYESMDGGRSWSRAYNDAERYDHDGVTETCDESGLCIRGVDRGVEESLDGGSNWDLGWTFPPERSAFMHRITRVRNVAAPRANDIEFVESGDAVVAFVAMGTDGVLRRNSDGSYDRNVNGSGWDLEHPGEGITIELGIAAVIAVSMLLYVSTVIIGHVRWVWVPLTLASTLASAALTWVAGPTNLAAIYWFATIPVAVVGALVMTSDAVSRISHQRLPRRYSTALFVGPVTGLAFYGVAYAWSAGWIDRMTSMYLAGSGVVLLGVAWFRSAVDDANERRSHSTSSPMQESEPDNDRHSEAPLNSDEPPRAADGETAEDHPGLGSKLWWAVFAIMIVKAAGFFTEGWFLQSSGGAVIVTEMNKFRNWLTLGLFVAFIATFALVGRWSLQHTNRMLVSVGAAAAAATGFEGLGLVFAGRLGVTRGVRMFLLVSSVVIAGIPGTGVIDLLFIAIVEHQSRRSARLVSHQTETTGVSQ